MVYVDDMRAKHRGMTMCHCIADTHQELLDMMAVIGLDPRYIQSAGTPFEHVDLCLSMRAKAVEAGACEVSIRELTRINIEKRRETQHGR